MVRAFKTKPVVAPQVSKVNSPVKPAPLKKVPMPHARRAKVTVKANRWGT